MNDKLTPKREKFCQNIVKGMTQADAYRNAFNAKGMADKTIIEKASRLMAVGNIRARVEELQTKVEDKLAYSLKESFAKLVELQDKALAQTKIDLSNAIKAEELKGKLAGLYEDKLKIGNIDTTPFEARIVK